jgi:hypothetical protein
MQTKINVQHKYYAVQQLLNEFGPHSAYFSLHDNSPSKYTRNTLKPHQQTYQYYREFWYLHYKYFFYEKNKKNKQTRRVWKGAFS